MDNSLLINIIVISKMKLFKVILNLKYNLEFYIELKEFEKVPGNKNKFRKK